MIHMIVVFHRHNMFVYPGCTLSCLDSLRNISSELEWAFYPSCLITLFEI